MLTVTLTNIYIHVFADQVTQLVSPFIHNEHQSVSELQWEITYICKEIINIATRYLPHKKPKDKKSIIKDEQLQVLCKSSKAAWRDAGRPVYDPLAEQKKDMQFNILY